MFRSLGAVLLLAVPCALQAAPDYGVACFIADSISLVNRPDTTVTYVRAAKPESRTLFPKEFEALCRTAVVEAIKRYNNDAGALQLAIDGPAGQPFYQDDFSGGDATTEHTHQMRRLAMSLAESARPRTLIVVSKMRGRHWVDALTLRGLGFYADFANLPIANAATNTDLPQLQYLAPYAYLRIDLIDGATGDIVRSSDVYAHEVIHPKQRGSLDSPWEIIDDQSKLEVLGKVIVDELHRSADKLLSEAPVKANARAGSVLR